MSWEVILFESKRREKLVAGFILQQPKQARAKIAHAVRLLETHGHELGMPHSKMLGSGIYELRIRGKEELRIFYCFKAKNIYLLHGFKKQSQKTPQKEFNIALERKKGLT